MDKVKMAYLLLAHKCPEQVNIFIDQLLDYGACDIYIHIDKKAEGIISKIKKNEHVFIISSYFVSWGSFEIPRAALALMEIAINSGKHYSHFYFGSCQDLLVKKGLYEYLAKNPDNVFISISGPIDNKSRASARYRVRWPKKLMIRNDWHPYRFMRVGIQYLCRIGIVYKKNSIMIPGNIVFYEGRTWFIAPRQVIEYIIGFIKENPNYIRFWEESLASDLMFFQTIIMNSPFKDKVRDELMYVKFGKTFGTMNHPLDITITDDEFIENGNYYCARKFNNYAEEVIAYYLRKTKSDFTIAGGDEEI